MKKNLTFVVLSLSLLLIDQITKFFAKRITTEITLIPNFLSLIYHENLGAAFSMLQGQRYLFIVLSVVVIGVIFYYLPTLSEKMSLLCAVLLAGVVGNLIDRVFLGFVVDFINFSFWPVFNVADICITVAAAGLIYLSYR